MKKKLVALSLTLAMLTSVVMGCGGSSTETASTENAATENAGETTASGGGYTIATVVKDMSDPWCLRHEEGVKEYAAETGNNCYVKGPAKTDSAEQIQVIEQLISQDIDALCVVPIDPEACAPVLQKARDKGIVVITHEAEGFEACDYDLEAFNNQEYGEAMMDELKRVTLESVAACEEQRVTDWTAIKNRVKSNLSGYLYKTTRRSPMILPVISEI